MARELNVYFARLYPISKPESSSSAPQYLAVSHDGVRLVERQKGLPTDTLEVSGIFVTYVFLTRDSITLFNVQAQN
jgi:hypothetical protein